MRRRQLEGGACPAAIAGLGRTFPCLAPGVNQMSILKKMILLVLTLASFSANAFDHNYRDWNSLLAKHVKLAPDGNSSRVDYRGMAADQVQLRSWLKAVSAVPEAEYKQWPKAQRLAFLINAYKE